MQVWIGRQANTMNPNKVTQSLLAKRKCVLLHNINKTSQIIPLVFQTIIGTSFVNIAVGMSDIIWWTKLSQRSPEHWSWRWRRFSGTDRAHSVRSRFESIRHLYFELFVGTIVNTNLHNIITFIDWIIMECLDIFLWLLYANLTQILLPMNVFELCQW